MQMNYKVCVLGAGSFGTALAQCAASNRYIKHVTIYARDPNVIHSINTSHFNPKNFSDFTLNPHITATSDLKEALKCLNFLYK